MLFRSGGTGGSGNGTGGTPGVTSPVPVITDGLGSGLFNSNPTLTTPIVTAPTGSGSANSSTNTSSTPVSSSSPQSTPLPDWRLKLSLSPTAYYLYKDSNIKSNDILYPLSQTAGVVFPYTPQIQVGYKANYDAADIVHSNYKMYF